MRVLLIPTKLNAARMLLVNTVSRQFYVMNQPDRIAYNAFEKDLLEDLAPVGANERQLAITLAQNNWRLNRARAIESNIVGLGHLDYVGELDADTAEVETAINQAKIWLTTSADSRSALSRTRSAPGCVNGQAIMR